MPHQRIPRILGLTVVFLISFFLSMSCKESVSSPTAPGAATVSGTVVSGDADTGTASEQAGGGLAGVTVRVLRTGQSTQTDGSGNFTLVGVPAGQPELQFTRGDIDARGTVTVAAGASVAIVATILKRSTVVVAPRGNPNAPPVTPTGTVTPGSGSGGGPAVAEIEGLVTSVGSGSLTVFDERLGLVTINVTATTTIRRGGADIPLSQILVGMRVHVKATQTGPTTYAAIEIVLQNEITKTVPTSSPTAAATGTATPTTSPTATSTSVPPTNTPTATSTSVPPTNTPTATSTSVPPTSTPTATATPTPHV